VTALPTTFDPLFRRYAGSVPVAYLRALAQRESSFNPQNATGPAWGLLQITEVVRQGTGYSRSQLLDPEVNIKLGAGLLNRIAQSYAKHADKNMQTDWSNPEFVKLVTAGWNSGYSDGGGVGKVARYLHDRGIPVTHDNVFKYAGAAGATKHLQNPQKQLWQRSVSDLYFAQPDAASSTGSFLWKAALAIGAGLLLARALR
jgi:soluble lytic murein transglycosylase-like protein